MNKTREELVADLRRRVADHILEPTNAALLERLIMQAVDDNEAVMIASLGTTYKRTGLHFDKRLERPTPEIHYLRRNKALSFGDDENPHRLIIGDNLHALQNLLIQYRGQVDVIYIDPPYGKDSMGEFAETNYENAITRDNLLSMLHPRLMLARQLLSDSGVIFCSIDDRNQAYVKCLFDDVFGERNFIATLCWRRRKTQANLAKFVSQVHEYILVYSREIERTNINKVPYTADFIAKTFKNPDNDPKGLYQTGPLARPDNSSNKEYTLKLPNGREITAKWSCSQETFNQYVAEGRLVIPRDGEGMPRIKIYLSELPGMIPNTWLDDIASNDDASRMIEEVLGTNAAFAYSKPKELIEYLVKLVESKSKDALVLDFFAGSGTTGQAVLELNRQDGGNRRFILCQLNEVTDTTPNGIAHDVTAKRLKRVMTGECYDGTRDFAWAQKNQPYGGSLEVADIATVADFNARPGQSAFDVIDETLYGQQRFERMEKKVEWVCRNFEPTQVSLEGDREWRARRMEADQR